MRDMNDLIAIKIKLQGTVSLDLERVEEDNPRWENIAHKYNLGDPEQRKQALFEYLASYLSGERLFDSSFMPSTNGPADLFILDMEDVTNGNGTSSNSGGDQQPRVRTEAN
jgi:hypothetical protein